MGSVSPPAVLDGVVYLTAVNTAYALDEATGKEIWSYGTEMCPLEATLPLSLTASTTLRLTPTSTPWTSQRDT